MKAFIAKVLVFTGIQALVFVGLFVFGRPTDNHYMATLLDKRNLLDCSRPPRLVLVGGSSVAFGVDSLRIKEEMHVNPVNMGLHAGLGLDFMLCEAERGLVPGDSVLVSMEYEHFSSTRMNAGVVAEALRFMPSCITYIPVSQLMDDGFSLLRHYTQTGVLRRKSDSSEVIYRRSMFNRFGDNIASFSTSPLVAFSEVVHSKKISYSEPHVRFAVSRLNAFAARCFRKNIDVYYLLPPYPDVLYVDNGEAIVAICDQLVRDLQFRIINKTVDSVLPESAFFDTEYHLNPEGVSVWTDRIIHSLKPECGNALGSANVSVFYN